MVSWGRGIVWPTLPQGKISRLRRHFRAISYKYIQKNRLSYYIPLVYLIINNDRCTLSKKLSDIIFYFLSLSKKNERKEKIFQYMQIFLLEKYRICKKKLVFPDWISTILLISILNVFANERKTIYVHMQSCTKKMCSIFICRFFFLTIF